MRRFVIALVILTVMSAATAEAGLLRRCHSGTGLLGSRRATGGCASATAAPVYVPPSPTLAAPVTPVPTRSPR
jgi:hypothetical protein